MCALHIKRPKEEARDMEKVCVLCVCVCGKGRGGGMCEKKREIEIVVANQIKGVMYSRNMFAFNCCFLCVLSLRVLHVKGNCCY